MWEVGAAERAFVGEHVCGDGHLVAEHDGALTVVVTDGLGHGPSAAEASSAFLEFVAREPGRPLNDLMTEGSAHISQTRGAAVSILRVDPDAGLLTYCGVGNCHLHTVTPGAPVQPVSMPGIVGHRIRKVVTSEFALPEAGVIVLCSDGMPSRFDIPDGTEMSAQQIADALLAQYGKNHDDVTVVVVRLKSTE